jgi:DNA polymerase V
MGFPSPAADFAEDRLSLDEHLVEHREATFFVRASGNAMAAFGIHDGDLLVVDRAIEPADQSVVVAVINGEFAVKQLCHTPQGVLLRAGDDSMDIAVGTGEEISIWGVVRWSIHRL